MAAVNVKGTKGAFGAKTKETFTAKKSFKSSEVVDLDLKTLFLIFSFLRSEVAHNFLLLILFRPGNKKERRNDLTKNTAKERFSVFTPIMSFGPLG